MNGFYTVYDMIWFSYPAKTTNLYSSDLWCHNSRNDITGFCFTFIAKTTHLYYYDVTNEITVWKIYLFTSHL